MRVITVGNIKGGTGKTTLATGLAALAAGDGKRVLLVDADSQRSAQLIAAARDDGRPRINTIGITTPTIHERVPELAADYDMVVIDVGGRDTKTLRSALLAADDLLVPVAPGALDVWSVFDVLAMAAKLRDRLTVAVVLTMLIPRTKVAAETLEAVEELVTPWGGRLLDTTIHHRVAWRMAAGEGLAVTEYAPRSAAAGELRRLAEELEITS